MEQGDGWTGGLIDRVTDWTGGRGVFVFFFCMCVVGLVCRLVDLEAH